MSTTEPTSSADESRACKPCAAAYSGVVPIALFGIEGDGIGMFINLLVVFLIAIWFALVFWTYADSRRRLQDPVLIGSATIAALIFPFAGALVYTIVRPPETLDDAYERELDVRAAELRVRLLESAVKGGPGSSAHSAAVSGEMTGEPTGRRSSPPPGSSPRRAEASSGRKAAPAPPSSSPSSGRQGSARQAAQGSAQQRPAEGSARRAPEGSEATRPAQSSREPGRRPPAAGTDGA